jgi:long-chain fatty acid transport protein
MSIGMSVIGNGANTRYTENFFQLTGGPFGTLGVSLIQMQMLPTIAYRMTKNQSIGLSLTIGVQQFRAYGLGNIGSPDPNDADFQFSSDAANLSNRGNDYSYGAGVRVGWLGKFFKQKMNFGAYYASRTYMTKFDKYKGLFAEEGSFDIPEHFGVGIAFKPWGDKFVLAGDIQKIRYSGVKSIANSHPTSSLQDPCTRPIGLDQSQCLFATTTPQSTSRALGADDGFGFGWKDQTIYKVGVLYKVNNKLTIRAGYNYGRSPIPDNQILFNLLATAVTEKHATAGLTYVLTGNSSVDISYVHAFKRAQVCAVADGCTTLLTQTPDSFAAADLVIDALGISYQFKF